MAKIRDSTVRDVPEKLRRLTNSCEIEKINTRFNSFDCTGGALDDFRVKGDCHEAEMVELRRPVELGSAPSPPLNQLTENDRFPILTYSGERSSTLTRFL